MIDQLDEILNLAKKLKKIETIQVFINLPALLLTAMRKPKDGVMPAPCDLAIEVGWRQLAHIHEEIMWMCEAAHIPVIWATQVLKTLVK